MKRLLAFCFFFAVAASAQVQSMDDQTPSEMGLEAVRNMARSVTSLLEKKMKPFAPGCFANCGDRPRASQACADAWGDVYSKPTINVSITLGYSDPDNDVIDASPATLTTDDSARREVWAAQLQRPCDGTSSTCGFKKVDDDGELFEKEVVGPDQMKHVVRVSLVSSSASYFDSDNRTIFKREQDRKTKRAEENFYKGIAESDVLIYEGHARNGGGASFSPSILHPGTARTNERMYADRASEKRMLAALAANPHPPKLIGLFACDAKRWFAADVRNATKNKSGVVSSIGMTENQITFAQAYGMLDSVLAQRCENEFTQALNAKKNISPRGTGKGVAIDGLFVDPHPRFEFREGAPVLPWAVRTEKPLDETLIHPTSERLAIPQRQTPLQSSDGVK